MSVCRCQRGRGGRRGEFGSSLFSCRRGPCVSLPFPTIDESSLVVRVKSPQLFVDTSSRVMRHWIFPTLLLLLPLSAVCAVGRFDQTRSRSKKYHTTWNARRESPLTPVPHDALLPTYSGNGKLPIRSDSRRRHLILFAQTTTILDPRDKRVLCQTRC